MDPFSFRAGLEQQAAQEFVNIAHTPIFRTLGRSFRRMIWNLIRTVQMLSRMLINSLGQSQMDAAARQQRQTSRERLIDNRNP